MQERDLDAPPDDAPVVLAVDGPHGPVIHATARGAEAMGARIGQRVVDARAAAPDLIVAWGDPSGDAALLARLALWVRRWGPYAAADGADGLVVDTTGADHLFGGEAAMLADMEGRLANAGLSSRLAVAPTRGAAWALARFGPVRAVCHDPAACASLPVAALRLSPDGARTLARLGLKTVAALSDVPRSALMRRFARGREAEPLVQLDRLWGRLPEPVAPAGAPDPARAVIRLAEPVQDPTPHLPDLTRALCAGLARRGEGARRLRLTLFRVDGEARWIDQRTARPTRDAGHMVRLFDGKLEGIDPDMGFDALLLEAEAERLDAAQPDLAGEVDQTEALAQLIDRLAARLRHVTRPVPRDSHVPERAQALVSALQDAPVAALDRPPRPPLVLETPEELRVLYAMPDGAPMRFRWRGQTLDVARFAGPERIAPEWWADRAGTRVRDYWRVEDAQGRRFWIFREGLHGDKRGLRDETGAWRDAPPRWWLHGISG